MKYIHASVYIGLFLLPLYGNAATLRLTPNTGVYISGNTFTASIVLNTEGKPINAADAVLSFNPKELSVVTVQKGSLFSLWTTEPTFSNTNGSISFGGGSPSGYTGSDGTIATVTFRASSAGAPKVNFKSGSVLAADGLGTNVLTAMNGASYTIEAKSSAPPPEYIPPVNTPGAPVVTSDTHPDESKWYKANGAHITWKNQSDVTDVRTAIDQTKGTIPTKLFEEPISERTIDDLPQGTSYFHVQLKNNDGWGRVAHYTLNVDSEEPTAFTIREDKPDSSRPERVLLFDVTDISPVIEYEISIDGKETIQYRDPENTKRYSTPALSPGDHSIVVEAFDSAGNSRVETYTLTITPLPLPVLTEYPERFNSGLTPVFRGTSVPGSRVYGTLALNDVPESTVEAVANDQGNFTLIPEHSFESGTYSLTLYARTDDGALSNTTEPARFIVEEPGYIVFGSLAIRALSVIVPLIALVFLLVFGSWFLWHRLSVWRRGVVRETEDAEQKLVVEFDALVDRVHAHLSHLKEIRKAKLTKSEETVFDTLEHDLRETQGRLKKEISDIETVVE